MTSSSTGNVYKFDVIEFNIAMLNNWPTVLLANCRNVIMK
jgi:hypothetical protein